MANYDKPARSQYFNGPLYDRMAEDRQLTGKAQRTVHGYLRAVRCLADHCRKAPDRISESELRRYFLYLKNNRQAAYGTLRVALSGIRFFYRTTCPRDWNVLSMLKLKKGKQPKSKPASQPQPKTDPQSKRKRKPHDRME